MTDPSEGRVEPDMEGPGALLRRARESRGLMLHDIAQELHLDEWMLEALEKDDFAALGAPVFAKGHLRKVGSMLGLDTDDLMIAYYRKRGRDDAPPPITTSGAPPRERERDRIWLRRSVLVVVAATVLTAIWLLLSRDANLPDESPPASVDNDVSASQTAPPAPTLAPAGLDPGLGLPDAGLPDADAGSGAATDETAADDEPAATATADDAATEPAADAAPPLPAGATPPAGTGSGLALEPDLSRTPAAGADTVVLTLRLDGESWVEVTDRTGERLVYGILGDGRSRTVSGQPPVEVFLGRARAVTLSVDGEDYPIPRDAVRGNTARLVIGDDR